MSGAPKMSAMWGQADWRPTPDQR